MRFYKSLFIFLIITLFSIANTSYPCTTFCFQNNGDWIYGRNFDWDVEHCLIMVNKRNISKTAWVEQNPAKWIAKYGSVTFNQYGREFPLGGINEAGLVIECLWLQDSEYPHSDPRPEISELQWIQYQLDTAASINEVLASDKVIRISRQRAAPLHFLVCDRKGEAAVIEFLKGQMISYIKENLPTTVLTNNTYQYSKDLLKSFKGDETSETFRLSSYSIKRFIWAAKGVKNWDAKKFKSPIDYAFQILDKVSVNRTMIRVVYDAKNGYIYFKTKSVPHLSYINIKKLDFSCLTPVKILDLYSRNKGDVTSDLCDYTFKANHELIRKSYSETGFLRNIPENIIKMAAHYPGTLPCNNQ